MDKIIISILLASASLILLFGSGFLPVTNTQSDRFYEYTVEFSKSYETEAEYELRRSIYIQNMAEAEHLNSLNPLASFGETKFSDLSEHEMPVNHMIRSQPRAEVQNDNGRLSEDESVLSLLANYVDWSEIMQPIQDQGSCGSCWAFAATATFEARYKLRGYGDKKFAEQELVDCVGQCYGCNGGLACMAFDWLKDFELCEEADYPYQAYQRGCESKKCHTNATDSGTWYVPTQEIEILKSLQSGPVSASVDATSWRSYQGGIMTECGDYVTHAVVVVGYGNDNGTDYWLIRNSYGSDWGEDGHIRLQYGKNLCDIASNPVYPLFY